LVCQELIGVEEVRDRVDEELVDAMVLESLHTGSESE
jgi:hypothetical protein